MTKRSLLLILLLAAPAFAEDLTPRIEEGIRLHDAGKYTEAIAVFREVLAKEPSNVLAAYELSLTYMTTGDAANCIAAAEPFVDVAGEYQVPLLTTYGSGLDIKGEPEKRRLRRFAKG